MLPVIKVVSSNSVWRLLTMTSIGKVGPPVTTIAEPKRCDGVDEVVQYEITALSRA